MLRLTRCGHWSGSNQRHQPNPPLWGRGSAAPPTMVLEENIRVSGVSPASLLGGKGVWRAASSCGGAAAASAFFSVASGLLPIGFG